MLNQEYEKRIIELEEELELAKLEIERTRETKRLESKWRWWFITKIGSVFLGWRLKDSFQKLLEEIESGKVYNKTLGEVISHILWRFTRIGIFGVLVALIPISFLALQTYILAKQNEKLDYQNDRIEQQTYLQEAERRSSLVFLFSNVLDKIDEELKDEGNTKDSLSNPLIGRIISLSQALKPYQYLNGDTIISKPISPERGQLLISLIESKLDSQSYKKIFDNSYFGESELEGAYLSNAKISTNLINSNLSKADLDSADLSEVFLSGSDLTEADLSNANLTNADLSDADLAEADLSNAILIGAELEGANLNYANLSGADLRRVNLSETNLKGVNFTNTDLRYANLRNVDLTNSDLNGANLYGVNVSTLNWFQSMEKMNVLNLDSIASLYRVDSIKYVDSHGSIYFIIERKKLH